MSFHIEVAGTPAAVIKHVQDHEGHGDTSQVDAAKAFIVGELEAWPYPGVHVSASGHHDTWTRNVTINLRPINIAAEPPEAEQSEG